jgi:hypothetical protein
MKRGDKVVLFVDILGFARLTEDWPRRIVHRRHGSIRSSGTSESNNRLSVFHSVLDQTILEFAKFSGTLTSMSFSDCAFVLLGNPYLTGEFAAELMQHYIKALCPVRMGLAAGTFWPGRLSSDVIGSSSVSRAIFHGTAIVRAHAAEGHGGAGMRIFIHESLDSVPSLGPRPILKFPAKKKQVIGELSYLHHANQYRDVNDKRKVDDEDQSLWTLALLLRQGVNERAPRRVHQQYVQTLAALQRMRRLAGREPFKRSRRP